MDKWQLIETAPRDGSIIKVRCGTWLPFHAWWRDGSWQPIEYSGSSRPTLWLPSPPNDAQGAER